MTRFDEKYRFERRTIFRRKTIEVGKKCTYFILILGNQSFC